MSVSSTTRHQECELYEWEPDAVNASTDSGTTTRAAAAAWGFTPTKNADQHVHSTSAARRSFSYLAEATSLISQQRLQQPPMQVYPTADLNPGLLPARTSSFAIAASVLYQTSQYNSQRHFLLNAALATSSVLAAGNVSASSFQGTPEVEIDSLLEVLQEELQTYSLRGETIVKLLGLLKVNGPSHRAVRSYTCGMRLLPKILEQIRDEDLIKDLIKEFHRSLKPFISTSRITLSQVGEIFIGLKIYRKLKIDTPEEQALINDFYNVLLHFFGRNNKSIGYLNLSTIFDALSNLKHIFANQDEMVALLIRRTNRQGFSAFFPEEPESRIKLRLALGRYGFPEGIIQAIMGNGYPTENINSHPANSSTTRFPN